MPCLDRTMAPIDALVERWRGMGPVRWAQHRYGWVLPETGMPIRLEPWQAAVLSVWWERRDRVSTLGISNVKKTGKTTCNAVLLAWRWLAIPGEHYAVANDLDQSRGRQFQMVSDMVKKHPLLADQVTITRDKLTFTPTGSTLEALAVDAAGNAGANHHTASHTESWGIIHEGGIRAWEELTVPPGRRYDFRALRIADSYAGWLDESDTWHDLVDRGTAGERVSTRWPIFQAGGLLLFHMEGEEAQRRCYRGGAEDREQYYVDERASMRANAFTRLHENRRTSTDSRFIDRESWDACILPGYHCPGPNKDLVLYAGLDLGIKHDHSAFVSVFRRDNVQSPSATLGAGQGNDFWLAPFRCWLPAPVVDLGAVEQHIVQLRRDYGDLHVALDPYQGEHLRQRLTQRGIDIREFPQTEGPLTEAAGLLFDLIRARRLVIFEGAEVLRDYVLAAAAKEGARGVRLVKSSTGQKVDAAIALAMGCHLANTRREYGPPGIVPY